jgi:hypothetical protein
MMEFTRDSVVDDDDISIALRRVRECRRQAACDVGLAK